MVKNAGTGITQLQKIGGVGWGETGLAEGWNEVKWGGVRCGVVR